MIQHSRDILNCVLAITLLTITSLASAKEIAFAFTNTLAPSTSLDGTARTTMLVKSLQRVDVKQSLFLIRTATITAKNVARMMVYDDEGQLLVNAGASQSLLSRKDINYQERDIAKANLVLSQYIHYQQHINIPYLYEGGDTVILSTLKKYLAEQGYQQTYTTYQAQDDYLDLLYQRQMAESKYVDLEKLKTVYVKLIIDDITAYDAQASLLLGYSPRQVILLHENDLTAYSMVNVVDALTEKGFNIISPEKIFSNPIANPFFTGGYSATGYMQAITGIAEGRRENLYEITNTEKQRVHRYLTEAGLTGLVPH